MVHQARNFGVSNLKLTCCVVVAGKAKRRLKHAQRWGR